jgi:isatin hydrolase
MEEPLSGKREGWPAPGPEENVYLSQKGIRCVGTDAPTLAGVEPKRVVMTCGAFGGKDMVGVEFLTNLGEMPKEA